MKFGVLWQLLQLLTALIKLLSSGHFFHRQPLCEKVLFVFPPFLSLFWEKPQVKQSDVVLYSHTQHQPRGISQHPPASPGSTEVLNPQKSFATDENCGRMVWKTSGDSSPQDLG